jgi:putative membrane protein
MMGMGFGVVGWLLMLLLWGGLILLAVWLVSVLFPRNRRESALPADSDLNAREILDRRYARGELDREQYELMKRDLK